MELKYKNPVRNPSGAIDVDINHPVYGWVPFTADPNDCEEYGRELFAVLNKEVPQHAPDT